MYLFAGNMLENSHVGILFIDFKRQKMKQRELPVLSITAATAQPATATCRAT